MNILKTSAALALVAIATGCSTAPAPAVAKAAPQAAPEPVVVLTAEQKAQINRLTGAPGQMEMTWSGERAPKKARKLRPRRATSASELKKRKSLFVLAQ